MRLRRSCSSTQSLFVSSQVQTECWVHDLGYSSLSMIPSALLLLDLCDVVEAEAAKAIQASDMICLFCNNMYMHVYMCRCACGSSSLYIHRLLLWSAGWVLDLADVFLHMYACIRRGMPTLSRTYTCPCPWCMSHTCKVFLSTFAVVCTLCGWACGWRLHNPPMSITNNTPPLVQTTLLFTWSILLGQRARDSGHWGTPAKWSISCGFVSFLQTQPSADATVCQTQLVKLSRIIQFLQTTQVAQRPAIQFMLACCGHQRCLVADALDIEANRSSTASTWSLPSTSKDEDLKRGTHWEQS